MVRLLSWNVNGVRSLTSFKSTLLSLNADIICLQETRLTSTDPTLSHYAFIPGYTSYFSFCNSHRGYSGVATYVRDGPLTPLAASEGLDQNAQIIQEGRVVRTDHSRFILFNMYVPATGGNEDRLKFRLQLLSCLSKTVTTLHNKRLILTGDFNITPQLLDTAEKIPAEARQSWHDSPSRVALRNLCTTTDLLDAYRHLHPKKRQYTCWSVKNRSRETNTGVRIDYFLISKSLISDLSSASILDNIPGSDHAPVCIDLTHDDYENHSLTPVTPPPFCTKFLPSLQRTQTSMLNFLTPTRAATAQSTPISSPRNKRASRTDISQLSIVQSAKRQKFSPHPNSESPCQSTTALKSNSPAKPRMKVQWSRIFGSAPRIPRCRHGEECKLKKVNKTGANRNRTFWACGRPGGKKGDPAASCEYFQWALYAANKPLPTGLKLDGT